MSYGKFSGRTDWDTAESDLAAAHRARLAAGLPVADLTASNPTRCGFAYPEDLLAPLTDLRAFDYDPDPRGSLRARAAVSRYYADHGAEVQADRIILTTSTSEAYGFLFKLLCDPGDAVLVPQPSYPLFDFLAGLELVEVQTTGLVYDHGWQLDMEGLRQSIRPNTRAIVLVHPNNPTGHFTKQHEAEALAGICREHGLALIVDEVFLDYAHAGFEGPDAGTFAGRNPGVPVFVVSGVSKICGLPQMKVAWLAALGPGAEEALARLEVIADTYLSMNAPVQCALPAWLDEREAMQGQIRHRVENNLKALDSVLAQQPEDLALVTRLAVEGGWYAVLRVPALQPDELTARELLGLGVWVHPGNFFGMASSGWLVVSLLGMESEFAEGVSRLVEYFQENHNRYQKL